MNDDSWLEPWMPLLNKASVSSILELGCDTGRDTKYLTDRGFEVTALDISIDAIKQAKEHAPLGKYIQHDLKDPLPFEDGLFPGVLASLSLHYFTWNKTQEIVSEIMRCLTPDGILICRLNSVKDINHGAVGFEEVEPNYFRVNGRYSELKRFFDYSSIRQLFDEDWKFLAIEEKTIDRYERPKVVWEIVLQKSL